MGRILVIDDDRQVCETLESLVVRHGFECDTANTLEEGMRKVKSGSFDVVFLDIRLPDGNGLELLPYIKKEADSPEVIILTGKGDPDGAELAIQGGVWDYLVKPSPIKQIILSLNRALKYRRQKQAKSSELVALNLENVVGSSSKMKHCFDLVAHAAKSDANVLITGETGTGKELFARTIHMNSARKPGNFVVVDCAALTESLVESTLFGHRKGAFTGAQQDSPGLVKMAHGGTLFLDEVGEMPLSLQKSFLRVLQERKFRPVGDTREVKSDFRLVSATNRDLDAMVERGEFRADLLFRLKTMHIELPPLRERCADLKPLVMHHVDKLCERYGTPNKGFDADFFVTLKAYDWPGNVRELFNVLERAFVASGNERTLFAMHLPREIRIQVAKAQLSRCEEGEDDVGLSEISDRSVPAVVSNDLGGLFPKGEALLALKDFKAQAEKNYLEEVIRRTGGDVQSILKISGLSRSHFYALLKKNGITL